MNKLNPEVKRKWVKALKSGDHKEIKGQMRSMNGAMDVLGVLCDVLREEVRGKWENESFLLSRTSHIYLPPRRVSIACGLEDKRVEDIEIPFNGGMIPLYRLNDDTNLTHSQIGDLIDDHL